MSVYGNNNIIASVTVTEIITTYDFVFYPIPTRMPTISEYMKRPRKRKK